MTDDALPLTPLQLALQQPGADALCQRHRQRLLALQQHCRGELQRGQPPAAHAQWQQRLAMCDAALRVLATLTPPRSDAARGPAAGALMPLHL